MEFEFERRRVTKEDIRELIFREILEYHPQLLKDYINGTERTNFLYPRFKQLVAFNNKSYCCIDCLRSVFAIVFLILFVFVCSAVDQFRKQFAHLEENSGKSAPVIPLERKHASLPR